MVSTIDRTLTAGRERPDSASTMLPADFLEWQRSSRISLLNMVLTDGIENVRSMPSHLPVLGCLSSEGTVCLATKGVGLLPKRDRLERFTSLFMQQIEESSGLKWDSTLEARLGALLSFYGDIRNFDDSILGGLEIFEGSTFSNLKRDPRASLLYTGEAPTFVSYQVDGVVEFVEKGDQYYEFLLAARELFAKDNFHVPQSKYPHGILFNVRAVRDKRPITRM